MRQKNPRRKTKSISGGKILHEMREKVKPPRHRQWNIPAEKVDYILKTKIA